MRERLPRKSEDPSFGLMKFVAAMKTHPKFIDRLVHTKVMMYDDSLGTMILRNRK